MSRKFFEWRAFENASRRIPLFVIRVCVFLLLSLLVCAPIFGQSPSPEFVPIAPETLSNSHVRCFFKDSYGYMWIGTEDALVRYDGRHAYRYINDPEDNTSIAHNTVNTIIESEDGKLWLGTAQGLCIYDRELDNFINVDSIPGNRNYLNNRYITDLEFDSQGHLWIGTHEGGVNIYDPIKREFRYITYPARGGVLPSSNFINILINIQDTIWCATKGGLLLYDAATRERLPLGGLQRFAEAQISSVISEKSGGILVATVGGQVTRIERGQNDSYSFSLISSGEELGASANRILSMDVSLRGDILLGGENSGFNIIDALTNKVRRFLADPGNANSLPTNSIEGIYADDRGLIWIGTFNNGVFLLDSNKKKFGNTEGFSEPQVLVSSDVRSLAEDAQGNVWLASYGAGISKLDVTTGLHVVADKINRLMPNKNLTSIIVARDGKLWAGTAGKGVYRVDPLTNEVVNYSLESKGFGNDQVFCLYEDSRGTIWAGTWGSGLFFLDPHTNQFVGLAEYDQPNHIPNTGYITDIMEDSSGAYWVGTLFGLYQLNKRSDYSFTYCVHLPDKSDGSIRGAQIQVILEDKDNNLWVGTTDGLNLMKAGTSQFEVYATGKEMAMNAIRSLLVDHHGNLWIGGNTGLSRFDVQSGTFVTYTREDGLKSNSFHRNSAIARSSGKLLFGSSNGLDCFYPDSIRTSQPRGRIVLSDLKVANRSAKPGAPQSPLKKHISLTSELELSYDQRSFMIDFVVLDHSQSSHYTYCYMLEGFDSDWNCGGNNNATYTNIDPGSYVLLVKAANRDGVWISEPLRLSITIEQVFWKTWWAYMFYLFVIVAIVFFGLRIRIERLKLKNEVMLEKLRREQEQKLSESKTQFFTNVAHEFRTPLSLIMIPLESLMGTNDVPSTLRERIHTAYKNAFRMSRLVNELLDFNKLEAGNLRLNVQYGELIQFVIDTAITFNEMAAKRKITFSVSADIPQLMGWFDRDKLERIIFNVLSNAFKFTADAGEIKLRISAKHSIIANGSLSQCAELVIEDNGIGISPEELPHIFEKFYQATSSGKISSPGTGIGLSLTKALVELHQGTISATSIPEKATIFSILIPVDGHVYQVEDPAPVPAEVASDEHMVDEVENPDEYAEAGEESDKAKVLVVEDNDELRAYLVSELRVEFAVLEARDGGEGLDLAMNSNPDLIISDIMMPVRNGIDLCREIKSDLNTSHIPFILLTAKATIEDQIRGIETGADVYLPKPFSIRFLVAHIHQLIDSRRQLCARFSQDVYLTPGKAATNALDQEFLQKAIDYVVANLQDTQLSVDSLAAIFNVSRMQIYRKIKALTGKSVVEFIRMVRMKEAIKLMDTHRYTLAEIAFEVGFNSASYFTKRFKEEYGKTPSEYLEEI